MKQLFVYALIAAGISTIIGAGISQAHGIFGSKSYIDKADWSAEDFEAKHERMIKKKAEFLRISAEELRTALDSGKTYREIAEENNIDIDRLIEERKVEKMAGFKSKMLERLNQKVAEGEITQ